MKISVIIPCYNEAVVIRSNLQKACDYLSRYGGFEIIVVDDGSTDGTVETVASMVELKEEIKLISNTENRGKGYCLRDGVRNSSGDIVLLTDADMSISIEQSEKFIRRIDEGYDIVIGSRYDPCVKSPKKNIHTALQKTFANIMPYDSEQWRASARAEPRDALDNNTRDGKTE